MLARLKDENACVASIQRHHAAIVLHSGWTNTNTVFAEGKKSSLNEAPKLQELTLKSISFCIVGIPARSQGCRLTVHFHGTAQRATLQLRGRVQGR